MPDTFDGLFSAPGGILTQSVTLRLSGAIPAYGRYLGTIPISSLTTDQGHDALFQSITEVVIEPVEGLLIAQAGHAEQPENRAKIEASKANAVADLDVRSQLFVVIENPTDATVEFEDVILTARGIIAAVKPSGYSRTAHSAVVNDDSVVQVYDRDGSQLDAATWAAMGNGDADTLEGHPASYFATASDLDLLAGEFAPPVQDAAALRAIGAGDRDDKQIRLVEDLGGLFRFDSAGTGSDDGALTIKPTDVSGGDPGRWYKTSATTQDHEGLTGLLGGASNDHQHLTTTQVGYLPSSGEKAALVGTSGTPGSGNRYVTDADSRNTNSRAPSGSAGGDLGGTYPDPTVGAVHETGGPTKLTFGAVADGEYLKRSGSTIVSDTPAGGGATDFTDLGDVPASYTGEGEKFVAVKADETGLEFVTASPGADGAGYAATSTTSNDLDNSGTKTWTTQAGLAYSAGARVRITESGGDWMEGVVSSYSGTSLAVVIDSSSAVTPTTFTSWTINIAGEPGVAGGSDATSIQGETVDATAPNEGDVLTYDSGQWTPLPPTGGGASFDERDGWLFA